MIAALLAGYSFLFGGENWLNWKPGMCIKHYNFLTRRFLFSHITLIFYFVLGGWWAGGQAFSVFISLIAFRVFGPVPSFYFYFLVCHTTKWRLALRKDLKIPKLPVWKRLSLWSAFSYFVLFYR